MLHDLVVEGRAVMREGLEEVQIALDDGKIAEVRKQGLKGSRTIRTGEGLVFPGFIDPHVHLSVPGWEMKEDFRTGTRAAAHGGVTTVMDMPNTPKPATNVGVLSEKARLANSTAVIDVRFLGGVTEDLKEVENISDRVAGYKVFLARTTGDMMTPAAELPSVISLIAGTGKPVSLHCEDQELIDANARKLAREKRPDVHCDVRSPETEVSSVRALLGEVRRGGAGVKANICHASTAESLLLIGEARSSGLLVSCEAALHHLYFTRSAMLAKPELKTNPPLRGGQDRDALEAGLVSGRVDFLVTDHAPHLLEEKRELGLSGVPGLDNYANVVAWLIRKRGLDPLVAARVCSANQAAYFGLRDRGRILPGARGDLTVLDLKSEERASADRVLSKCGWTPYEGEVFPGRARWTISAGKVLLDDFEMT